MRIMLGKFWRDDCGAVSPEWMLMASVLALGSVAALAALKHTLSADVEAAARAVTGM